MCLTCIYHDRFPTFIGCLISKWSEMRFETPVTVYLSDVFMPPQPQQLLMKTIFYLR